LKKSWQQRLCGENYNTDTGEVLDQADTDGFYSWGALLPLIKLSSTIDVTPWSGLIINLDNVKKSVGPVRSPIGELQLQRQHDYWGYQQTENPRVGTPWRTSSILPLALWCESNCWHGIVGWCWEFHGSLVLFLATIYFTPLLG